MSPAERTERYAVLLEAGLIRVNNPDVDVPGLVRWLRTLTDVVEVAKPDNLHHDALKPSECHLCQALARLEALPP